MWSLVSGAGSVGGGLATHAWEAEFSSPHRKWACCWKSLTLVQGRQRTEDLGACWPARLASWWAPGSANELFFHGGLTWDSWSPCVHSQESENDKGVLLISWLALKKIQSRTEAQGRVLSMLACLPISTKLTERILQRGDRRLASRRS